jgi:hypothetical protein
MAMIAITTSSSISVNAHLRLVLITRSSNKNNEARKHQGRSNYIPAAPLRREEAGAPKEGVCAHKLAAAPPWARDLWLETMS